MSKNYESLQISGIAQRLFATFVQESARVTSGIFPAPHGAQAGTFPNEEGWASSNDGDSQLGPSLPEPYNDQLDEGAGRRAEQTAPPPGAAVTGILGRGRAALRSIVAGMRTLRLAHSYPKSRATQELASVAREEQVKLMQRVFLTGKNRPRIVVFCGIERGNGCSRVCAESAVALAAQISGNVCLVDADLRSPTLHNLFGLNNGKGFAEAMGHLGPMEEYSHRLNNLWIMTSGAHTSDPFVLFTSETLRPRIKELREAFDFVLIDAPPVNPFADAIRLGPLADGVILVMGANSTRREAARKATQDLRAARARVLAAVLNRRRYAIPETIYRRL